ncbi:MAG: hypothetical protein ACOX0X_03015 [Candidatus Dojkabacteria bacterium]
MNNQKNRKSNIIFKVFLLTLIVFGSSQLVVNSILTPLGVKLQTLNSEKEYLLEENRKISEDIAKNNSIKVIENLSEKKLNLTPDKKQTVLYITDKTLVANRSNE